MKKIKSPSQWLMDNWKRERGALYLAIVALLIIELIQSIILMAIYLK